VKNVRTAGPVSALHMLSICVDIAEYTIMYFYGRKESAMRQKGWIFIVTAMILSLFATSAPAAGGTGGVSLSAALVPIGAGDAGDDSGWVGGVPEQDEAFNTGWGVRIEPFYDFNSMIRGQAGVAYNRWGGKSFGNVKFEDLKITTYYVGVKIRFLPDSNIRPYVVTDIGAASIGGVKVSGTGVPVGAEQYWNRTTTVFLDIGGGVEFQVSPKVSFFLDMRIQATGEPDSANPPGSDADGIGSIPISAGVNIAF
jgi:opacity protein-like surface antigen